MKQHSDEKIAQPTKESKLLAVDLGFAVVVGPEKVFRHDWPAIELARLDWTIEQVLAIPDWLATQLVRRFRRELDPLSLAVGVTLERARALLWVMKVIPVLENKRQHILSYNPLGSHTLLKDRNAPDKRKEVAANTLGKYILEVGVHPARRRRLEQEAKRAGGYTVKDTLPSAACLTAHDVEPPDVPLRLQLHGATKEEAEREADELERWRRDVRNEGRKAIEEGILGKTQDETEEEPADDQTLAGRKPLGVGGYTLQIDTSELGELADLEQAVCKDNTDRRIFRLLVQGQTERAIAKELGMSQPAVSKRVAKMKKRWQG